MTTRQPSRKEPTRQAPKPVDNMPGLPGFPQPTDMGDSGNRRSLSLDDRRASMLDEMCKLLSSSPSGVVVQALEMFSTTNPVLVTYGFRQKFDKSWENDDKEGTGGAK